MRQNKYVLVSQRYDCICIDIFMQSLVLVVYFDFIDNVRKRVGYIGWE